ncbi:hypothetical protein ACNSOP_08000 [Aliarcobacter lanthieri]|uniref:hypothetical protein n=1 Tax=Aliarcobacter lanthieri TaxID=1355374 RepID=UPI003AAE9822
MNGKIFNSNMNCKNRVKPKLLRDIKTEALLVFIRTTLEQYFDSIDNGVYYFELSNKEDNEYIFYFKEFTRKFTRYCYKF